MGCYACRQALYGIKKCLKTSNELIYLYFYLQYFFSCSAMSEVTSQSPNLTIFSVPVNYRHEKYISSERTRNMQNIDIIRHRKRRHHFSNILVLVAV